MLRSDTVTRLDVAGLAEALEINNAVSDVVGIDWNQVDRMARHIADAPAFADHAPARWDDPRFWNVEAEPMERSQFFAIGNSINFRFWEIADRTLVPAGGTIEGEYFRGALYMWRCLRRAAQRTDFNVLDAEFLRRISEREFDSIFVDDSGVNPLRIGCGDRIANLRDLGERLEREWDGRFFNVLVSSDGSLERFARLSAAFRAFDDPVYKLTMVNAIVHSGSQVYEFNDDPLPAIDYHLVRHALRQRLIVPVESLAEKLRCLQPLGRYEGQELRRVALIAFVGLASKAGISGEVLDNKYWLNRANCSDEPVCLSELTAAACPFLQACRRVTEFALPIEETRYY